jgi:hypothetical protein
VKITGENTSFSQYSQGNTPVTYIEGIYLKKGNSVYTVDPYNKTVKINSGTEIEADINIPAGAPEGLYNIAVVQVVQYGSDRYSWVGEELFTMEPDSQIVKPIDSAKQGENTTIVMNDVKRNLNGQYLTDCFLRLRQSTITKRDGLDNKITGLTKTIQDNIDLLTSVIKVIKAETVNAFGPSSVRAVFRIPDDAPVGMYDFVLELNKSELVELLSTIEVQAESKGVEEFAPGDEFVRFIPNPVKDNTKLIFYENNNNDFEITFYNPLGIKTGDFVFLSSRGGYKSHELDLSYLASGIYYYTITCGKRRLSGILSKVK